MILFIKIDKAAMWIHFCGF